MALDAQWAAAFPDRPKPPVYASDEPSSDGYLPLTDPSAFLVDSISTLTSAQLFTLTEHNAHVLQEVQRHWTELERSATKIKTRDPFDSSTRDPQALPSHEIFEERKEARLYGYKYEANRPILPAKFTPAAIISDQEKIDCREPPNPFRQAGLIPTEKQYKSIMATAKAEGREHNPDNMKTYTHDFAGKPLPPGTWVVKALAPELPPQQIVPRTRAAQLNATGDRQTRFNGEKVPNTRGISTPTLDTQSPQKRPGTPAGLDSPVSKRARLDDLSSDQYPKKKHPNQYTKRRDAEEVACLAEARANGADRSMLPDGSIPTPADTPPIVKKKHPNQYTKRREREEAERLVREQAAGQHPAAQYPAALVPIPWDNPPQDYYMGSKSGSMPSPYPGLNMPPTTMIPEPVKKKHPNQHTKRREREEAERLAALPSQGQPPQPYPISHSGTSIPPVIARLNNMLQQDNSSFYSNSRQTTPATTPTQARDTTSLTDQHLRERQYKEADLVALLKVSHRWCHDDPARADEIRDKVLSSKHPIRTWAAYKKWKEWRSEGKDKRPRGEKKNTAAVATGETVNSAEYGRSGAQIEQIVPSTPASPRRRNTRLRRQIGDTTVKKNGTRSPQPYPSSPLVNGTNTRDLDIHDVEMQDADSTRGHLELDTANTNAKNQAFGATLKAISEVDSNTKVGTWRNQTQPETQLEQAEQEVVPRQADTEYSATMLAGKGVLKPRLLAQGTEDEMGSSSSTEQSQGPKGEDNRPEAEEEASQEEKSQEQRQQQDNTLFSQELVEEIEHGTGKTSSSLALQAYREVERVHPDEERPHRDQNQDQEQEQEQGSEPDTMTIDSEDPLALNSPFSSSSSSLQGSSQHSSYEDKQLSRSRSRRRAPVKQANNNSDNIVTAIHLRVSDGNKDRQRTRSGRSARSTRSATNQPGLILNTAPATATAALSSPARSSPNTRRSGLRVKPPRKINTGLDLGLAVMENTSGGESALILTRRSTRNAAGVGSRGSTAS